MRAEPSDREQLRQWVENWRRAGPELEEIRRREIEQLDTREAIRQNLRIGGILLSASGDAGYFRPR